MSDENDLYLVCNILVGDDSIDPVWNSSRLDFFEVRWEGEALRIPPGETMIIPKYLADHFAKHLVDHILTTRGVMIHNSAFRDPLLSQIILRKSNETDAISRGTIYPNAEGSNRYAGIEREKSDSDQERRSETSISEENITKPTNKESESGTKNSGTNSKSS